MGSLFSNKKPQQQEKNNENSQNIPQEEINTENNPLFNPIIEEFQNDINTEKNFLFNSKMLKNENNEESLNNINLENNPLIDSTIQYNEIIPDHENLNNIIFHDNSLLNEESNKENKNDSFMSKKRYRDNEINYPNNEHQFSFSKNNNTTDIIEQNKQNLQNEQNVQNVQNEQNQQNQQKKDNELKEIEEERKKLNELLMQLKNIYQKIKVEIDEKLIKDKKIKDKIDLKKSIRIMLENSIIQDKNIDKYESIYNSLKPDIQTSFREHLQKVEEMLNAETVIKTEIINNENKNNENMNNTKQTDTVEPNEKNQKSNDMNNNNLNYHPDKDNNLNEKKIKPPVIKNITLKDLNNYSFKCLTENLYFTMYKGLNEVTYKLTYENDGECQWPKNRTILSTDKSNSNIKIQDILMEPLNPGSQWAFDIKFRNMNNLPVGKYYSYLDFKVNGKKYGNSILINVEIIEKNKKKYDSMINLFRNEHSSDKKIASDTIIDNPFDKTRTFERAFQCIIDNNESKKKLKNN